MCSWKKSVTPALHKAIIHNLKGSLFLAQKKTDAAKNAFGRP
jgi:predicted negative regulator of RcsB-dependent stress response